MDAGGTLAKLLALTGQIGELDLLLARFRQIRNGLPMMGDWKWATEMRAWVRRHPNEAYKCGLYCLDQLGRLTQPAQFIPKNITETDSSTNGFTAADLLTVAGRVGLRVHAALLGDTNDLPVPCILHLRSEHFVFLRERRGSFYEVVDPVNYGPRWLLASEILEEATGCVIVSDASPPANAASLVGMTSSAATQYRGRCHGGTMQDGTDHGGCVDCPCPPGTWFGSNDDDNGSGQSGVFDRILAITNAVGQVEFYGLINDYGGSDWVTASAPTNTPVGTLDTDPTEMSQRNTYHWNAQQFAPYVSTDLASFTYSIFMQGRIRHWLASTDPGYTHFDTLSSEQLASPDGTTLGQTTWYDYIGKPPPVNYEIGAQVLPSVIARVMPDGSTWYQYFEYLTNGRPTKAVEAWIDSGTVQTRTNIFVYAANNIDLIASTNALGTRILANSYNAYHQIVTNFDALGQVTTNGYSSTSFQITSSQKPSGLITLYAYNGNHRLQSVIDLPVNRTNSYTWNADGTMATRTDPLNMVETYFWDSLHRLTGTSDTRGSTTNLYYVLSGVPYPNSSGGTAILDRTATKDRLGNWISYVYDGARRKIAETNANGVVTGYGYCGCGSVNSVTNAWNTPVQEVTTFNFDNQGRLTNTLLADGGNQRQLRNRCLWLRSRRRSRIAHGWKKSDDTVGL
jgi:YD repeat-containing protein